MANLTDQFILNVTIIDDIDTANNSNRSQFNFTDQSEIQTELRIAGIDEFRYASEAVLTGLSCLGVIMNLAIMRYSRKLRKATGDLTHSFVCSMAFADLLLCLFAQPFEFILEFLTSARLLAMPDWICRLQHMISWLGYSASGLSLTLLNLDKLIFFKWPLHYNSIDADTIAWYSISACWLVCSFGTIMMIVPGVLELSDDGDCATDSVSAGLYIFYTIAFCILPIVSSAFVSAYLASLVSRMTRNRKSNSSTSCNAGLPDSTVQQRLRAMAYIFITTAWTFVALSPFRLFNILRLYYAEVWYADEATYAFVSWTGHIFFFMLALNPFVDACLTLCTYAPYKNLARSTLIYCKTCILRNSKPQWL